MNLTLQEIDQAYSKLISKRLTVYQPSTGCKIYRFKNEYSNFECTVDDANGEKKKIKNIQAHRFALYARYRTSVMPVIDGQKLQCSHLCHNEGCVNTEHVRAETSSMNNFRKTCKKNGYCTGHGGGHPDCIF